MNSALYSICVQNLLQRHLLTNALILYKVLIMKRLKSFTLWRASVMPTAVVVVSTMSGWRIVLYILSVPLVELGVCRSSRLAVAQAGRCGVQVQFQVRVQVQATLQRVRNTRDNRARDNRWVK